MKRWAIAQSRCATARCAGGERRGPLPRREGSCSLRIEADQRVIVVAGLPVHHYRAEDAVAEAYAMVFLVESGFAQQHGLLDPRPLRRPIARGV
jgi:hypothetical protein